MDRSEILWMGRRARAVGVAALAALAVSTSVGAALTPAPAPTVTQPPPGGGVVIIPRPGQPALQQPPPDRPAPRPGQPAPGMPPRDRSGRPAEPVTGTATISGTVTDVATGLPLRRVTIAAISMSAAGQGPTRAVGARTGDDGTYTLRDLPAGQYMLTAQRAGYASQQYGQTSPGTPPRRVTVEDKGRVTGINFPLQPAGVITGRVMDEAGEPAEGVMVQILRGQKMQGRVRYVPAGVRPSVTDDQGHFRAYGLAPGEYIASARFESTLFGRQPVMQAEGERLGAVTTYAPSSPAPSEAQRYTVSAGQELLVDIQLVEGRVATVAGRVVDSTGKPVNGGMVNMVPQDAEVMTGGMLGGALAPDGSFQITGVAPGAYTLNVMGLGRRPMSGPDDLAEAEGGSTTVVVSGEDIADVLITTSPPTTITGRVVVEGDASALQPATFRVFAQPVEWAPMVIGPQGTGRVDEDLRVRVSGLRGTQTLMLSGLPRGWWMKSVRINGQDVLRGFDFGQGRTLSGLEIVVNDRPASVGGIARRADGQPSTDYTVLVFPENPADLELSRIPGMMGMARADQQGHFIVESLRPGTYHAIAVEELPSDTNVFANPDALREFADRAELITVAEGEQKYLTLTVVQ